MSLEFVSMLGNPQVFCIDLEWLGDLTKDIHSTRIHSMAAVHCATRQTFSVVVDPAVSKRRLDRYHTFDGCRKVTRSWLRRHNAVPMKRAFAELVEFVRRCVAACAPPGFAATVQRQDGFPAILIAHGCFRADLPVLKSALRRCRVPLPVHWRFFDSLMFFRRVMPSVRGDGCDGYTLRAVASSLGVRPSEETGRAHDALPDALVLHAALILFPRIYGALYSWWQTPLTVIGGVGLQTQSQLISRGIRSAEDLLNFAQRQKGDAGTEEEAFCRVAAALASSLGLRGSTAAVAHWCVSGLTVFEEVLTASIKGDDVPPRADEGAAFETHHHGGE